MESPYNPDAENANWIEYGDCLLQYYLHVPNPETLSDEIWVSKLKILEHIRQSESKTK
jgi:hypothetical protein